MRNFESVVKVDNSVNDQIKIESDMPFPVKGVDYSDVMRVYYAILMMEVGQSFFVRIGLAHTVKKINRENFPEYRIICRGISRDQIMVIRRA